MSAATVRNSMRGRVCRRRYLLRGIGVSFSANANCYNGIGINSQARRPIAGRREFVNT